MSYGSESHSDKIEFIGDGTNSEDHESNHVVQERISTKGARNNPPSMMVHSRVMSRMKAVNKNQKSQLTLALSELPKVTEEKLEDKYHSLTNPSRKNSLTTSKRKTNSNTDRNHFERK